MGYTALRIPERDWKAFKEVRESALQRYCERVLGECADVLADEGRTPHERYVEVFSLLRKRDIELEHAFDSLRRSTALLQLVALRRLDLISEDEMGRFSGDTRDFVEGRLDT